MSLAELLFLACFFFPGTDLSGTLTKRSVRQTEPADCNVVDKLNKVRVCETELVRSSVDSVGLEKSRIE